MPQNRYAALDYALNHRGFFIERLSNLLEIPSVSTDPDHAGDMHRAALWIAEELKGLQFSNIQIFNTPRHPIVYAENCSAGPAAATILVYGHYDVQPAQPFELWVTPPFQATLKGENLYARGASDMKGQVMAAISAVRSIFSAGDLPVNLKFVIEGEEEIGSPNLNQFLMENKPLLACDFALNADSGMIAADIPTIVYGLRGLAYFELRITGPSHDLHSGLFGGVVHNPAIVLADLISKMHDDQGRITLGGFYDRVRPMDEAEKQAFARLPMNADYYIQNTGAPKLWGEAGFSPAERVGTRPTLDVCGMLSGFTGTGSKTVIPSWAMAKISMRLVPDQDPHEIHQQLLQFIKEHVPASVTWDLQLLGGAPATITRLDQPGTLALAKALESVWNVSPMYKREGGSIPVVTSMQKILGIDSVITGFGLPDDNLHSPNEKLHLPTWHKGIQALIHFFYNIAENK